MTKSGFIHGAGQQTGAAENHAPKIRHPLLFILVFAILGLALPMAGAGFILSTPQNRSIVIDTALAWGLGHPVEAEIRLLDCRPFAENGVRWSDSGLRCHIEIATPQDRATWPIVVSSQAGLERMGNAGNVAGHLGIYNPPEVLADRSSRLYAALFVPIAFMIAILAMAILIG